MANCLFFAENLFGEQFCIFNGKIYLFDPETGDKEMVGNDFEEWAKSILDDYHFLTGYFLGRDWQAKNGSIPINNRLLPKIPFVCGPEFDLDNTKSDFQS